MKLPLYSLVFWFSALVSYVASADAPKSNSDFKLSASQQAAAKSYAKLVEKMERSDQRYHFFKKLKVTLKGKGSAQAEIMNRETMKRREYVIHPVNVIALTKQWRHLVRNQMFAFTPMQTESEVKVPFFCHAFKGLMPGGQDDDELIPQCKKEADRWLATFPDKLTQAPAYLVIFEGNYYGNFRYVKLYLGRGDKGSKNEYLVFDFIVYDNPFK